jgi:hypothetical protein
MVLCTLQFCLKHICHNVCRHNHGHVQHNRQHICNFGPSFWQDVWNGTPCTLRPFVLPHSCMCTYIMYIYTTAYANIIANHVTCANWDEHSLKLVYGCTGYGRKDGRCASVAYYPTQNGAPTQVPRYPTHDGSHVGFKYCYTPIARKVACIFGANKSSLHIQDPPLCLGF